MGLPRQLFQTSTSPFDYQVLFDSYVSTGTPSDLFDAFTKAMADVGDGTILFGPKQYDFRAGVSTGLVLDKAVRLAGQGGGSDSATILLFDEHVDAGIRVQKLARGSQINNLQIRGTRTIADPRLAIAEYNGNDPLPPNTVLPRPRYVVVTTTGANASIGDLLYDDGTGVGTMAVVPAVNGRSLWCLVALPGGTISLNAEQMYVWDGAAWNEFTGATGILIEGRAVVEDVGIYFWDQDCLAVAASEPGGNANFWEVDRVHAGGAARYGVWTKGADANSGKATINVSNCGVDGIREQSLIGNTYDSCSIQACGDLAYHAVEATGINNLFSNCYLEVGDGALINPPSQVIGGTLAQGDEGVALAAMSARAGTGLTVKQLRAADAQSPVVATLGGDSLNEAFSMGDSASGFFLAWQWHDADFPFLPGVPLTGWWSLNWANLDANNPILWKSGIFGSWTPASPPTSGPGTGDYDYLAVWLYNYFYVGPLNQQIRMTTTDAGRPPDIATTVNYGSTVGPLSVSWAWNADFGDAVASGPDPVYVTLKDGTSRRLGVIIGGINYPLTYLPAGA